MPPSDSNTPLSIEDVIEAANQIRRQGLQPNQIIMHPETWRQLVETIEQEVISAEHLSIDDIVTAQPMTAPTSLLFYMDYKHPEPIIYRQYTLQGRIEDIMDELLCPQELEQEE